jgi:hypothetical protein
MTMDINVFEAARDAMARWLANWRTDFTDSEPTEHDLLMAGHLAGVLADRDLLVDEMPKSLIGRQ